MNPFLNVAFLIGGYVAIGWIATVIVARFNKGMLTSREDAALFIVLWPVLAAAGAIAGIAELALRIAGSAIPQQEPTDPILEAAKREVEEIAP